MSESPRRLVGLLQSGRSFQPEELDQICQTVESFPSLTRTELVRTLCEHLDWRTVTGRAKLDACQKLLEKLEKQGRVRLPAKRVYRTSPRGDVRRVYSNATQAGKPLEGRLGELGEVRLEVVHRRARTRLWNEYVDRYHYLGFRRPFGCTVRYFVGCDQCLLGCVLLAGAAHSVACRDRWIGWGESARLRQLPYVVNNTRFLIFPWIRVQHLASHVLGQVARRVHSDWEQLWDYAPVLLETFVDPQRFRGTCYRAAGWIELGLSSGEGRRRPGRRYTSTPKRVLVRPLVRDFRAQLCEQQRVAGRGDG